MLSRHLGVVGAGTMGSGIAETAITHGFEVILYDVAAEILARAHERIQSSLDRQARRGRVTPTEAQAVLARLHLSTRLEDLGAAGLIIEAAPEDLALKRGLFAALDRIASPQTILASNTSSLSITALAEATRHPQRVVGMHFFNPAPVMPLVEVIPGRATAPEVVGEAMAAARGLGKTPVEARDTPGFIVNRIARPFYLEALRLLDEGVAPVAEIDRIVRLAGRFRMGPFELLDLIGLDVNLAVTRSVYEAFSREPRFRPHPLQEQMVQAGRLGRKSGRGFYVYGEEGGPDGESAAPPPAPILRDPQRVVVIGAGGLAEGFQAAAQAAGWTVTVFPADPFVLAAFALEAEMDVALTRARKAIRKADAVVDFTLSPGERILALNPLTETLAPGGVLLSLALTMSLTHLATFLNRLGSPGKRSLERVVGFATLPPWQERGLIEILPGPSSSPDAVAASRGVFRALGKETAVVKDTVGGVFPRIFAMIVNEAAFALAEGVASAEAIDTALRLGANYPQGPLALADEIGLEIFLQLLEPLHEEAGEQYRPAPFLRQAVEAGRTGRTAGRGFHMYTDRND